VAVTPPIARQGVAMALLVIVLLVAVILWLLLRPGTRVGAQGAHPPNVAQFLDQTDRVASVAPIWRMPAPERQPIDLSRPLAYADWARLASQHPDPRFLVAHQALWARYRGVANPMTLANSLAERMETDGITLREAVIRLAEEHAKEDA